MIESRKSGPPPRPTLLDSLTEIARTTAPRRGRAGPSGCGGGRRSAAARSAGTGSTPGASRRAHGARRLGHVVVSAADIEALPGEARRTGPRGSASSPRTRAPARRRGRAPRRSSRARSVAGWPRTSPPTASTSVRPSSTEDPTRRPTVAASSRRDRRRPGPAQLGDRCPGRRAGPSCMTPRWVQICSTSESRWLETSTVVPSCGERGDQVPDLAGALRVEAVGRLVEDEQVARREQRGGDGEPLPHAQRVGAVALRRGRQQADPVERGVDPRRARCAGRAGRSAASSRAGSTGRRGRGGTPAPRPGRRPGAGHAPASARDRRARAARSRPDVGLDQAEQHPDRRGLARAVGSEEAVDRAASARPGRWRRRPACAPNRLRQAAGHDRVVGGDRDRPRAAAGGDTCATGRVTRPAAPRTGPPARPRRRRPGRRR